MKKLFLLFSCDISKQNVFVPTSNVAGDECLLIRIMGKLFENLDVNSEFSCTKRKKSLLWESSRLNMEVINPRSNRCGKWNSKFQLL